MWGISTKPAEKRKIVGNRKLTLRQKRIIAVLAVGIYLLLTVLIFVRIGRPLVAFLSEPEKFRIWLDGYGIWGRLVFMGMVVLQVVVAIIPGEPFEIAGGYAFGVLEGTVWYLLASAVGSLLVFGIVRLFGMRLAEIFVSEEKLRSLRFLHTTPKRNRILFLLFLMPGTPKDLLSYFVGLTDLPWKTWAVICSVGRIPSVITSVLGEMRLEAVNIGGQLLPFPLRFS